MSDELLEALHRELDFDKHVPDLQKVQGVWKQVVNLQQRVRKDKRALKQYRAFIERCIKQLTESDPELSDAEIEAACTEFNAWRDRRMLELDIASHEAGRLPKDCEAWCQKWLPKEWENVQTAFGATVERTTKRTIANLKKAWDEMLLAYLKAV